MLKLLLQNEIRARGSTKADLVAYLILYIILLGVMVSVAAAHYIAIIFVCGMITFSMGQKLVNRETAEFLLTRAVDRKKVFWALFAGIVAVIIVPIITFIALTLLLEPSVRPFIGKNWDRIMIYPFWLLPVGISMSFYIMMLLLLLSIIFATESLISIIIRLFSLITGMLLLVLLIIWLHLAEPKIVTTANILITLGVVTGLSAILLWTSYITFTRKGLF